ncbi:ABC transporter permease [Paenibacillus gansuensis]|uniref:ABC transporter permease n=1 Tax=Paenibacillus gansuensis TaxID=306542 RepID=A0ABW5PDU3_9BACL
MMLPGIVFLIIFNYIPMVGISIAFQDYNPTKGFFGSEWVGLRYFKFMLELPDTSAVVRNTLIIAGLKIFFGFLIPILFALLLNEVRQAMVKRMVQTMVYFPHFLSWVILGGILIDILSMQGGAVNQILSWFSIDPVFFLGDPQWFRAVLISTDVWKEFGFSTIIYLAALSGINPQLYEAAVIDGANRWKQTLNITIPGILPVAVLMATLSIGGILNAGFDQIFNLYNALVYDTGDIIDTFVYRIGLVDAQYSLATAVGLFKSVVSLILISVSYALAYRFANYRIF